MRLHTVHGLEIDHRLVSRSRHRPDRQEPRRKPADDVVHKTLGDGDLRVLRVARRLEPHVAELLDQGVERHAVLEREGDGRRESVHETRDRGAFLGHRQEDLPRGAVLVEADGDVALVPRDRELVRERAPLVGQLAASWGGVGSREREHDARREEKFTTFHIRALLRPLLPFCPETPGGVSAISRA